MTYTLDQIKDIIFLNPNKVLVALACKMHKELILHTEGIGMKDAMQREDFFENKYLYESRYNKAVSNKDVFHSILNEEEMIFTARGGTTSLNLKGANEKKINAMLADVVDGISLHKWIETFALPAFRSDPMSVILMEVEPVFDTDGNDTNQPKCYPTYKSITTIFDYELDGRDLNYVCFKLKKEDLISFGITDPNWVDKANYPNPQKDGKDVPYYRFIDGSQDIIVKKENNAITTSFAIKQKNPIKNSWGKVPAFITSDLIYFANPKIFGSPLQFLVELGNTFLFDRSVRDLQKRYHGFAKAIEPLLKCSTCGGEGLIKGSACPDCTIAGQDKGSGYKLQSKISDVAKFPLEMLKEGNAPSFDFKKIFGYVTPDIESWNKQDLSLMDQIKWMYQVYWHTPYVTHTTGMSSGKSNSDNRKTATETISNLQPKYARLNNTADWAEKTETAIANLLIQYVIGPAEAKASISYGRNYILETPQELYEQYRDQCNDGVNDEIKDASLERYYRALYQSDATKLAIMLKLMNVIPFPHLTVKDAEVSPIITQDDKLAKMYSGEWIRSVNKMEILSKEVPALKDMLTAFVAPKLKKVIEVIATEAIQVQEKTSK